jgi:hypothetical protein
VHILDPFFKPRTVAIVGLSRSAIGAPVSVLTSLESLGYQGRIYLVNPGIERTEKIHAYQRENIQLEAKNVVIVGASNIVGKPMALMLMRRDATVCICHAKTRDLAQFTIFADILVVAAGKPNLILPQMVKTGAVVIDVGINRLPNRKLVGDVDFVGLQGKASHITPVPGGVGPMTVTMLLENTVASAEIYAKRMENLQEPPLFYRAYV